MYTKYKSNYVKRYINFISYLKREIKKTKKEGDFFIIELKRSRKDWNKEFLYLQRRKYVFNKRNYIKENIQYFKKDKKYYVKFNYLFLKYCGKNFLIELWKRLYKVPDIKKTLYKKYIQTIENEVHYSYVIIVREFENNISFFYKKSKLIEQICRNKKIKKYYEDNKSIIFNYKSKEKILDFDKIIEELRNIYFSINKSYEKVFNLICDGIDVFCDYIHEKHNIHLKYPVKRVNLDVYFAKRLLFPYLSDRLIYQIINRYNFIEDLNKRSIEQFSYWDFFRPDFMKLFKNNFKIDKTCFKIIVAEICKYDLYKQLSLFTNSTEIKYNLMNIIDKYSLNEREIEIIKSLIKKGIKSIKKMDSLLLRDIFELYSDRRVVYDFNSPVDEWHNNLVHLRNKLSYIGERIIYKKDFPLKGVKNFTFEGINFVIPRNTFILKETSDLMFNCVESYTKMIKGGLTSVVIGYKEKNPIVCIEIIGKMKNGKRYLSLKQAKLKYNESVSKNPEIHSTILHLCAYYNINVDNCLDVNLK